MSVKITNLHLCLILNKATQVCVSKEAQNTDTYTTLYPSP